MVNVAGGWLHILRGLAQGLKQARRSRWSSAERLFNFKNWVDARQFTNPRQARQAHR